MSLQHQIKRILPFTNDWDKRRLEFLSGLPTLSHKEANEAKIRLTKYLIKIKEGGGPKPSNKKVESNDASHFQASPTFKVSNPSPSPSPYNIESSTDRLILNLPEDIASHLLDAVPGFEYHSNNTSSFPIRNADIASLLIEPYNEDLAQQVSDNKHVKRWKKQEHWRRELNDTKADTQHIVTALTSQLNGSLPSHLTLYPHQVQAIAFFEAAYGKALLCDEPGLGKTAPAILYNHIHNYNTIVLCPKSVLFNWAIEIIKWTNKEVFVYSSATKKVKEYYKKLNITVDNKVPSRKYPFFIANYDVATKIYDSLIDVGYESCIMDECHILKSWKARKTEASIIISQFCHKSVIGLSGTPLRNRPEEFYVILHSIRYNDFPDRKEYMIRYCGAKENHWGGLDNKGATHMDELHNKLKSVMLRRTKEVLPLPPKQIMYQEVPLEDERKYRNYHKYLFKKHYHELGGPLKIITLLKQEAAKQKLHALEITTTPTVIFYHHKEVGFAIEEKFKEDYRICKIDGSTKDTDRTIITQDFQNGQYDIMLASITAAGVGITLTAASKAIMFEQSWSPADELQCHDRLHRIGQTKPVEIVYLLGANSIDEIIHRVVKNKKDTISSVIDGDSVKSIILRNVIKELKRG